MGKSSSILETLQLLEFKQVMLCVGQHVFARVYHRRGYRVHGLGGRTVLKTVRGTTSQVSKQCTLSEVVIGIQALGISNVSLEGYSCMCIYMYIYISICREFRVNTIERMPTNRL